jgi:hypothetical protein
MRGSNEKLGTHCSLVPPSLTYLQREPSQQTYKQWKNTPSLFFLKKTWEERGEGASRKQYRTQTDEKKKKKKTEKKEVERKRR